GPPTQPVPAYSDLAVPRLGILIIISALDYRRRTGKGQYFDMSQQEGILQYIAPALMDYHVNNRELNRMGNRCVYAAPNGIYRCKGEFRWCAISVITDEEWMNFCNAIGKPDWIEDHRFITLLDRIKNNEILDQMIEEWTKDRSAEDVMKLIQEAGVAAGVVQNGKDLLNDPNLREQNFYSELDHPVLEKFIYSGMPVQLSKTPWETKRSPCFGEHNEYVYTQLLGISDEEFIHLYGEGVFE
ncbi:MAG: CoA transferase, partial [bacterium]